jgi:hypothetical protein
MPAEVAFHDPLADRWTLPAGHGQCNQHQGETQKSPHDWILQWITCLSVLWTVPIIQPINAGTTNIEKIIKTVFRAIINNCELLDKRRVFRFFPLPTAVQ